MDAHVFIPVQVEKTFALFSPDLVRAGIAIVHNIAQTTKLRFREAGWEWQITEDVWRPVEEAGFDWSATFSDSDEIDTHYATVEVQVINKDGYDTDWQEIPTADVPVEHIMRKLNCDGIPGDSLTFCYDLQRVQGQALSQPVQTAIDRVVAETPDITNFTTEYENGILQVQLSISGQMRTCLLETTT